MGKWYYEGDGKELFSHTPSYKKMEEPHATVHEMALKTVSCATHQDCLIEKNQNMIVKNMSSMEQSSKELFVLLDAMVEEANPEIIRSK